MFALSPFSSLAAETVVLDITLNGEAKGEFFVVLTEDRDFLVRRQDLEAMDIKDPQGKVTEIAGESYLSLKSVAGAAFVFNESKLSLDVTVNPSLLPTRVIDFRTGRAEKVYYPKDSGAFLNYGINYAAGDSFRFENVSLTNEVGARWKDLLFLTSSTYTNSKEHEKFTRLASNVTFDDRQNLRRFVAGDFFTAAGDLGSSVNLGGLSFSKIYRMDPYFINYPTLDFTGNATFPSEAEIYLDGVRIKTEKIAPGSFELRNLTTYGGAGDVEVVIKDPFGRVRRIVKPYYFTDTLLKKGLHEYSYNIGFTREDFGRSSNHYSSLVLTAFHRYGFTENLTVGFNGEAKSRLFNAGPQASFVFPPLGLFSLALAGSAGDGDSGLAGSAEYLYQGRILSGRLLARGFTRGYMDLATALNTLTGEKNRYELAANFGFSTRKFGSLSFDFLKSVKYEGTDRQAASVTYTRNITGNANLSATYRRIREFRTADEFLVSLNYYPWRETSISARYEKSRETNTETVQIQKNAPFGEGIGYRASVERKETESEERYTFNPFVQYNGRYGVYSAEFRGDDGIGRMRESYNLTAAGAVVYLGRTPGFIRPVFDSFGLVKVGDLEGVRVYQNSQEIGRTNASGKVFLPDLGSYYDNQVSINDKDIPMDYSLAAVRKFVSPPLRSGSCISFGITRLQPVTGILMHRKDGELEPLEFYEVTANVTGRQVTFPTGKDGEFYLDINQPDGKLAASEEETGCAGFDAAAATTLKPGKYPASLIHEGQVLSFEMDIPASDELFIDIGTVVIEPPALGGTEHKR